MAYIGKKPTDAALTSSDVADDIITLAKMAGGTDGNVITYDASGNPAVVATGSDGQVLTSTGAGSAPAFETLSAGKISQVVQATKTDTATVANASFTDMSGLTLNITPSASSSKVLVIFNLNISTANGQRGGIKLVRGSTDLLIGDAASNRNRTSHMTMSTSGAHSLHVPLVYLDSPSTTSATTYKIQAQCESGQNIHVNRTDSDTDNDTYSRSASSLVLMEVLA